MQVRGPFKSIEEIQNRFLSNDKRYIGFINNTSKEFYLSDEVPRSIDFDRDKDADAMHKSKPSLPSFNLNWSCFHVRYLKSDDEYCVDLEDSATPEIYAWARKLETGLYGLDNGTIDAHIKKFESFTLQSKLFNPPTSLPNKDEALPKVELGPFAKQKFGK